MQFLITTTFAVILLVGVASSCPSVCRCTEASRGVAVDCNNQRLWSIPKDIPKNTYVLYLQKNEIPNIDSTDFQNMTVLYQIDLSFNQITVIKSDTVKGLPKLKRLNLVSNKISVIEDNALNSTSLEYIDLSFNQITAIKSDTFKGLPNLGWLNMKNNKNISFVSNKAFLNLPQLKRLEFDMYCGCNSNIPFWTWLKVSQKFSLSIGCYDYNGLYLENVQPSNFYKCYAPSTPITTTSPTTATSTKNMTTGTPTSRTTASQMGRTTSTLTRRTISTPMSRTTITTTSAARITRKKLEATTFAPRVVIGIAIGAGSLAGGILLFCVICRLWRRSNDKDAKFEQQQDKINSVIPAIPPSTFPHRATEKLQFII